MRAQNGWPVVEVSAMDRAPILGTITVPNGMLRGDVAICFRWLAGQYDKRVERLIAGTCWGYDKKKISGSTEWSCHAAGCAVDFNADQHNMGDPPSRSMSKAQIDTCHTLERESDYVIRWGGDFGRPDPMHWEIVGTPQQVAQLAARIESEDWMLNLPVEGDQGTAVEMWQYELADAGFDPGAKDGVYGPKMAAAINKHRDAYGEGPYNPSRITGWQGRTLLRDALRKTLGV